MSSVSVRWHWTGQTVVVWQDKNSGSNKKGDSGGGIKKQEEEEKEGETWWQHSRHQMCAGEWPSACDNCCDVKWCDVMWDGPAWTGCRPCDDAMMPGRQTGVVLVLVSGPKPCFLPALLLLLLLFVVLLLYLCSSHIHAYVHKHPIVLCSINLICPAMLPPTFPFFP